MNKIHEILKSKGKERPAWQRAFRPLKPLIYSVMGTITHVDTEEPVVALTFDDGPHETFTPMLLETLKGRRGQRRGQANYTFLFRRNRGGVHCRTGGLEIFRIEFNDDPLML